MSDRLYKWVKQFNEADEEVYANDIPNSGAYEWLLNEIPLFECPDKRVEQTYYFRWWTYRKHIKSTHCGYVITEFLPKVPWSGRYNTINAAVSHHLREGRWLKNAPKYLTDYIKFFLDDKEGGHKYSVDFLYAVREFCSVCGDLNYSDSFFKSVCDYYEQWEREHGVPNGMFWSYDDRDAMEYSISGTRDGRCVKGIRPTLNSYMYADAAAIAYFAKKAGRTELGEKYDKKAENLKKLINDTLADRNFYKAIHPADEDFSRISEVDMSDIPRELIGYIPWCYGIPKPENGDCFDYLDDKNVFCGETGLTTAEQCDKRFMFDAPHECLWNGYVWPFATSQTLNALRYYIVNYNADEKYKALYAKLFLQYAYMHTITENGVTKPWIDEVMHPYRNEWTSRTYLKDAGWLENLGGYERGKDYNHSTFCDLLITGIVGVIPGGDELKAVPSVPDGWEWFKLEGLNYRGDVYTVIYDKTGEKYGQGKGTVIQKH